MIICMYDKFKSDIICVTNRKLCQEDFLQRIRKVAKACPQAIILREKDLSEAEYEALAMQVLKICGEYGVPCMLHNFTDAAIRLKERFNVPTGTGDSTDNGTPVIGFHAPLAVLNGMSAEQKAHFTVLGASCHSVEDAVLAQKLGCTYITAGHIFLTDSKKGLPGRGLVFLKNVRESVSIPVYAIGGISTENIAEVRATGAVGACVMGKMMTCEETGELLAEFAAV